MAINWKRAGAVAFATGMDSLVKNKEKYEARQKELADQSFAANQKFFDAKVSFAEKRRAQRDAQRKDVRTAIDTVSQTLQAKYGLSSNASLNYASQLLADSPTIEAAKIKSSQLITAADQAGNDPMRKAEILQKMNFKDADANLTLLEATNALTEGLYGKPYQLEAPTPEITTTSYWGATKQDKRAGIQKKQFEQIAGLYNEGIQRNTRDVKIPAFTGTMPQTFVERSVEENYNFAFNALNAAKESPDSSPDLIAYRESQLKAAGEEVSILAALKRKTTDEGGLTVENIISLSKTAMSQDADQYYATDPSRINYGRFEEREPEAKFSQGQEQNFRNYASARSVPSGPSRTKAFNEFYAVAAPLGVTATQQDNESARNAIARKYENTYNVRVGASTLGAWEEMFRSSAKLYNTKKESEIDPRMKQHLDYIYSKKPDGSYTHNAAQIDEYLGGILKKHFFIPTGDDAFAVAAFKNSLGIK